MSSELRLPSCGDCNSETVGVMGRYVCDVCSRDLEPIVTQDNPPIDAVQIEDGMWEAGN